MRFVEQFVGRTARTILYASVLATLTLFTSSHRAVAWELVTVKFDTVAGHASGPPAKQGHGSIGDANRGKADVPFTSRGFNAGSIIDNDSTVTVTDLHIKIINPDKNGKLCAFHPNSNGGAAFPKTEFTKDKDGNNIEITLSGGNIKVDGSFWSFIPLSSDFPGGSCSYAGRATPTKK